MTMGLSPITLAVRAPSSMVLSVWSASLQAKASAIRAVVSSGRASQALTMSVSRPLLERSQIATPAAAHQTPRMHALAPSKAASYATVYAPEPVMCPLHGTVTASPSLRCRCARNSQAQRPQKLHRWTSHSAFARCAETTRGAGHRGALVGQCPRGWLHHSLTSLVPASTGAVVAATHACISVGERPSPRSPQRSARCRRSPLTVTPAQLALVQWPVRRVHMCSTPLTSSSSAAS